MDNNNYLIDYNCLYTAAKEELIRAACEI